MKNENYTRSQSEIERAVELLKKNKSECSKYNMFGGDNHGKIDVKIDTIQNQRTEDYVYHKYPSVNEEDEEDDDLHQYWQAGVSALDYLRGNYEIEDLLVPIKK